MDQDSCRIVQFDSEVEPCLAIIGFLRFGAFEKDIVKVSNSGTIRVQPFECPDYRLQILKGAFALGKLPAIGPEVKNRSSALPSVPISMRHLPRP